MSSSSGSSSDDAVQQIRDAEKDVLKSPANANGVLQILAQFEPSESPVAMAALHALRRIFSHYATNGSLNTTRKRAKQADGEANEESMRKYRAWVRKQYLAFLTKGMLWLRHESLAVQVPALRTLMHFVCRDGDINGHSDQPSFGIETFERIVQEVVCSGAQSEILAVFWNEFTEPYDDVRFFTFHSLKRICERRLQGAKAQAAGGDGRRQGDILMECDSDSLVRNVLFLLMKAKVPAYQEALGKFLVLPPREDTGNNEQKEDEEEEEEDEEEEEEEALALVSGRSTILRKSYTVAKKSGKRKRDDSSSSNRAAVRVLKEHLRSFEASWLAALKLPLPSDLYRAVLLHLPKKVMPRMASPIRLGDFFSDSYNQGGVASLLALQGLFILINEHQLAYPEFYTKLYALLTPSVFHAKHRGRFFELVSLFLTSSMIPAYIVAAFAKRFVRLALSAPPSGALFVLPLVHNLLLRHQSCLPLIHRGSHRVSTGSVAQKDSNSSATSAADDPYLAEEALPAKCRALDSSLWELLTLEHHYHPEVARLASTFRQSNFTTERSSAAAAKYDEKDFAYFTYRSLIDQALAHKVKGASDSEKAPLAFKKIGGLYEEGDAFAALLA